MQSALAFCAFLIAFRLWGLRPNRDIRIEFTGLKPREKLAKIFTDTNEQVSMMGVGLSRLETVGRPVATPEAEVISLERLARTASPKVVHDALMTHIKSIRAKPVTGS